MAGAGGHLRNTFSLRTGEAHLRSLPAEHQLRMALGRLDDDVPVDPIVHELVHHVSGNSIVNVALQYRWLALLRSTLSSPLSGLAPDSLAMAADLVAVEALLQPFAEGLALFAEHDCAVADPEHLVITAYDALAIRLLSLRPGMGDRLPDFRAASVAAKQQPAQVARRADVLVHPLRPATADEAYLVGYLVVKAAWDRYVGAGGPLPAGGFLEYLEYWLYEDWRLAALVAGGADVDELAGYLRARAEQLLGDDPDGDPDDERGGDRGGDLADRVEAFMADKATRQQRGMLPRGPEERQHGPFAGLGLTADDVDAGSRTVVALHDQRIGPRAPLHPSQDPVAANVTNLTHAVLVAELPEDGQTRAYAERHPGAAGAPLRALDFVLELAELKRALGLLVDLPVAIAVEDGRIAGLRVDGGDWLPAPGPMPVAADDGAYPVRLVGHVLSATMPWSVHWLLVDGLQVVGGWSHAADDDDDHLRHLGFVLQFEEGMRIGLGTTLAELASMTSSQVLGGDAGIEAAADAATVRIADELRAVLADHGWGPLVDAAPPASGIDGGLRNLLPRRLVTALAVVGLVNSYSLDRAEVAAQVAAHGGDLDELIAACTDLPLLDVTPDTVRARV